MKRALVLGALLFALAGVSPATAQADSIAVTPAEDLLDGQSVEITATTVGSNYATLGLCPESIAPQVGDPTTDLLSTRNHCVGLLCLHDGSTDPTLAEQIAFDCPLVVQPRPISTVTASVDLPRVTTDGTDCAVDPCVIVFNTWTSSTAQGAVSAAVTFDDTVPPATTEAPVTTTTIELSAPTITSTVPPVTTVASTAPTVPQTSVAPTTVPTQVLGTQELNDDGELALTGFDVGALAGFGLALVAAGSVAATRGRRF